MKEFILWLGPTFSGGIGALIVVLMVLFTRDKSELEGNIRKLRYGLLFKIYSALMLPLAFFILYVVSQSYKGQEIAAFIVATVCIVAAVILPYQVFYVSFSYDKEYIYFKSPIAGKKKVGWENLRKVGYSSFLQSDYIVVEGIGRIWCSNMLHGYTELMVFVNGLSPKKGR